MHMVGSVHYFLYNFRVHTVQRIESNCDYAIRNVWKRITIMTHMKEKTDAPHCPEILHTSEH